MAMVITYSTVFPAYHSRKGEKTHFVEMFWNSRFPEANYYSLCTLNEKQGDELLKSLWEFWQSLKKANECSALKNHTIRGGSRFKKGDYFSPRVWSGKPYNSKQIIIAPDTLITDVWDFEICGPEFKIDDKVYNGESESIFEKLEEVALNDGLSRHDLLEWFRYPNGFKGQIICWNPEVKY